MPTSTSTSTSIGRKALQGLAAGIGLVSEAKSAHKLKKQQRSPSSMEDVPRSNDMSIESRGPLMYELSTEDHIAPNSTSVDSLERQWALDEAQEELTRTSSDSTVEKEKKSQKEVDQGGLAQRFISDHPAPPPYSLYDESPRRQLSAPVVLPQRRPKDRDRGFIRAYAPALGDCGIDQDMFLDFLDTAEKSCQATPWLNAINLASIGTMWLPTVTGIAVSIAIQLATDVAIAADGRRKTNSFFNKVNREFFQPRGLYCLVMTWNPELPDAPSTAVDLNSLVSNAAGSAQSSNTLGRLRHRFKSSDGKAYGNIFPEVAPLIFPEIDRIASDQNAGKKLSKMKQRKEFVGGYLDRRAQAKFTAENPTSQLNQGPKPVFTSRYADPNHPASSGDLLALVSGGRFTMEDLPRREALRQSSFEDRGQLGGQNHLYQSRGSSNSNAPAPPAPHGSPFGLFEAIDAIRDFRKPATTDRMPRQDAYGSSNGHYASRDPFSDQMRRQDAYNASNGYYAPQSPLPDRREDKGSTNPLAKLLKKEVMYLAIVNMPTDDEMRAAHNALGHANY